MTIIETLCAEFQIAPWQAEAVIRLLDAVSYTHLRAHET